MIVRMFKSGRISTESIPDADGSDSHIDIHSYSVNNYLIISKVAEGIVILSSYHIVMTETSSGIECHKIC